MKIGLLGGSFNPAHGGHRHISLAALKRLGLDRVWWLVSPQNPLKPAVGMAPLDERLNAARQVADDRRIIVSDIERSLGTRYTFDTLGALCSRHRGDRFVWLMGADNLVQISTWHRWPEIFKTVPVAVFNRPNYGYEALAGEAAWRFRRERLPQSKARLLADRPAPAWTFLWIPLSLTSATEIRRQRIGYGQSAQQSVENRNRETRNKEQRA